MNNILLIDDRADFIEAFTEDCAAKGYALYSKRSLAGLKELMPAIHHKLACVILDIKCLHTEDQEIEDPSFITSAITYLDQNFPKFPRLILTGDDIEYEQIKKYYRYEDVFLKTTEDKDRLFVKIKYYVDNSDELRIKRLNPEVFDAFKTGLIAEFKETTLYRLFKIAEDESFELNHFNSIREILEDILIWINAKGKLPNSCMMYGGRPNLEWSYRYLSGLQVDLPNGGGKIIAPEVILPKHVSRTLEMVKQNSSILSHSYSDKVTINAYKATLYGLAEILIWYKDYAKSNFGL
ncbi:MAG: hypothetical protein Q8K92_09245 [Leadbetterella sp.]|nr:hypothetical protein [Leadbetterella sp.]